MTLFLPMHVRIKRIDQTLPLPAYQTNGAAGFDLYSRVDMEIPPSSVAKIPTNVVIEIPEGYMLMVAARSGLPSKKGLSVPHGFGIIDSDFCGPHDEILFQVYNMTTTPVAVQKGERLGQGVFVPITRANWEEISEMTGQNRGGFGSTGA